MSQPSATPATALQPVKIVVAAMCSGLVLVSLVGLVSAGTDGGADPLWLAVFAVVALAGVGAATTVGFRVPPVDPADRDPGRTAVAALQSSTIVRCALVEAPGIVAVMLAFVSGWGLLALLGLVMVPVMLWLAWPTRSNVAKVQRALEAKGARTGLTERLFGAGTGGPMLPT